MNYLDDLRTLIGRLIKPIPLRAMLAERRLVIYIIKIGLANEASLVSLYQSQPDIGDDED